MDAAWVGLIGVGLGTVLTGMSSWLTERWRAARQDRQRWHEQRLEAYTTCWLRLSTVQEVFQAAARTAKLRIQPPWATYKTARQLVSADVALREAGSALTMVRFLASAPVVAAADRCADVLAELLEAYGDDATPPSRFGELVDHMNDARHDFVAKRG